MAGPEDWINHGIDRRNEQQKKAKAAAEKRAEIEWMRARKEHLLPSAKWLAKLRKQSLLSVQDPFFKGMDRKKKAGHLQFVADEKIRHASESMLLEKGGKSRKKQWLEEQKIFSDAFEYVIMKRINESGWFGNMRAQLASEYDDFKHGVDMYVERDGKPLALTFDVTFTSDRGGLAEKLAPIKRMLEHGTLSQLQYYVPLDAERRAAVGSSDGYPIALPKLIIGVTRDEMFTAIERYVESGDTKKDIPTGLIMLYQSILQLRHFIRYIEYIRDNKKDAPHTLPVYKRALSDLESVWAERLAGPPKLNEATTEQFVRNDPFTGNLLAILEQMMPTGTS